MTETAAIEKMKIALPFDQDHAVIHGDKIAFLKVEYDQDSSNPLENCDGMGTIYSFCRNHRNFMDPVGTVERDGTISDKEYKDGVVLSYFEHSQCRWFVHGGDPSYSAMPDFRWDGVSVAGLWMPDKCLLQELGKAHGKRRRDKLIKWAVQACEEYTAWCNGEVYCWSAIVYDARRDDRGEVWNERDDYRRETPIVHEATCGFVGSEGLKYLLTDDCMAGVLRDAFKLDEAPEIAIDWSAR